MEALRQEKIRKQYRDVTSTKTYPIGLGAAGFGWGGQAACAYIPELRQINFTVESALGDFAKMQNQIQALAKRDSSMGKTLMGMLKDTVESMMEIDKYLKEQLKHCG